MLFALVNAEGTILRYEDHEERPDAAGNKPQWLPVVGDEPAIDPVSEVLEGPTLVVSPVQVNRTWIVRAKSADELEDMRAAKFATISAEFQRRAALPVTFSVGGVAKTWDADAEAITNISGVVLMITAGVPIPDPRPWTAHGELLPTQITHAELVGLGATIAGRKDALFVAKKTLEAQLSAITDPAQIEAFDPTEGWD